MVKSVFTKYMAAFMAIILIGFTLLAAVVGTIVREYSLEQKRTMVASTSERLRDFIVNQKKEQELSEFLKTPSATFLTDMVVDSNEDLLLMVVDAQGNPVMLCQRHWAPQDVGHGTIPAHIMSAMQNSGTGLEISNTTLDGLLPQNCLTQLLPLYTEQGFVGAVLAGTPSSALSAFVSSVIKTIILTSFWVALAAMLAVYIISERIIGPLKHISSAAKSFGMGQYDMRVPVRGDDEVAELALAFNHMASSIADNEEQRRTFLANVSHDLRTPMTTISGFIDGILEGAIPPEKQEYYLNIIAVEVRRLSRLVGTLLDITRIQAGDRKFTMTSFSICEMARQILISFEQKIEAKHLDVEFECEEDEMYVLADHDAIYQILYNICDNAVKFSREGGKYRIRILARQKKIFTSVYNEGIGIPEGELPHIFDRFYKSDKSRGLDKTGVGLGLYIAKAILDAHKEEIWVKSRYNEYCEFIFTLPEAEPPRPTTDVLPEPQG